MIDESIDISIPQEHYNSYEFNPNTHAHTIAEFIDNAIQSFDNNITEIQRLEHGTVCHVDVSFEFDEYGKVVKYIIKDNAGGISQERLQDALRMSKKADDTSGLNEYGVGMKTAALWLGHEYTLRTKALDEDFVQEVTFNLEKVTSERLKRLPVKREPADKKDHYTIITISRPNLNVLNKTDIPGVIKELASIYRNKFRKKILQLNVQDKVVDFQELDVLNAPYYKDPNGPSKEWKVNFECSLMGGRYKAKGFLALLDTMFGTENRIVLLRRDRAVVGVKDNERYYFQCISGSKATPKDKRVFGEFEIEGFGVFYNKNDIVDKNELNELAKIIASCVQKKCPEFFKQAENFRVGRASAAESIIKKEKGKLQKNNPIHRPSLMPSPPVYNVANGAPQESLNKNVYKRTVLSEENLIYDYDIDDMHKKLSVVFEDNDSLSLFRIEEKEMNPVCYINLKNPFLLKIRQKYKVADDIILPIIRSLAIAEYNRYVSIDYDSFLDLEKMFQVFNQFLNDESV